MEPAAFELRALVACILETSPSRLVELRFAHVLYQLAGSYVDQQTIVKPLTPGQRETLLLEVVTRLLGRRLRIGVATLRKYYGDRDWSHTTDAVLWILTRRLVTGETCNVLLQHRVESDPSISDRVKEISTEIETTDFLSLKGNPYPEIVLPKNEVLLDASAPSWSREIFEAQLWSRTDRTFDIQLILGGVADVLRTTKTYRQAVPVTMLAVIT